MKIGTFRFAEYGKQAPKNSRFKGTIDTESLLGWSEYTDREEAKDHEKELNKRDDGFFGYTQSHTLEKTMSSIGFIEHGENEKRKEFRKMIAASFHKKGNLFFDTVISVENFAELEECGIRSVEDWNIIVNNAMKKFIKTLDLDYQNIIWWADSHNNTENPHIHLTFLEKEQTRTRGKITPEQLAAFKRYFFTEISARKKLEKEFKKPYQEVFKDKDIQFKEILNNADNVLSKNKVTLNNLYRYLPKQGRLQYNSYNFKPYRHYIDDIINDIILKDKDVQKSLDKWMNTLEMFEQIINDNAHDIATIKEAEMKKLYEQIGNKILKYYKKSNYIEVIKKGKNGKTYHKLIKKRKITRNSLAYDISRSAENESYRLELEIEEFLRAYHLS